VGSTDLPLLLPEHPDKQVPDRTPPHQLTLGELLVESQRASQRAARVQEQGERHTAVQQPLCLEIGCAADRHHGRIPFSELSVVFAQLRE
jgi:hypothetical protein